MYKGVSKEPAQFDCLLEQPEVSAILSKKAGLKLNTQSNTIQKKVKLLTMFKTDFKLDALQTLQRWGKTLEIFSMPQHFYSNIQN